LLAENSSVSLFDPCGRFVAGSDRICPCAWTANIILTPPIFGLVIVAAVRLGLDFGRANVGSAPIFAILLLGLGGVVDG